MARHGLKAALIFFYPEDVMKKLMMTVIAGSLCAAFGSVYADTSAGRDTIQLAQAGSTSPTPGASLQDKGKKGMPSSPNETQGPGSAAQAAGAKGSASAGTTGASSAGTSSATSSSTMGTETGSSGTSRKARRGRREKG